MSACPDGRGDLGVAGPAGPLHAGATRHLGGTIYDDRLLTARSIVSLLTGIEGPQRGDRLTGGGEPRISALDGATSCTARGDFSTDGSSAKGRHLAYPAQVSVAHVDGEEMVVFSHGRAVPLAGASPAWRLRPLEAGTTAAHRSTGATRSCSTSTGRAGWSATSWKRTELCGSRRIAGGDDHSRGGPRHRVGPRGRSTTTSFLPRSRSATVSRPGALCRGVGSPADPGIGRDDRGRGAAPLAEHLGLSDEQADELMRDFWPGTSGPSTSRCRLVRGPATGTADRHPQQLRSGRPGGRATLGLRGDHRRHRLLPRGRPGQARPRDLCADRRAARGRAAQIVFLDDRWQRRGRPRRRLARRPPRRHPDLDHAELESPCDQRGGMTAGERIDRSAAGTPGNARDGPLGGLLPLHHPDLLRGEAGEDRGAARPRSGRGHDLAERTLR